MLSEMRQNTHNERKIQIDQNKVYAMHTATLNKHFDRGKTIE